MSLKPLLACTLFGVMLTLSCSADARLQLPRAAACRSDAALKNRQIVFVLDRTTTLGAVSKRRWHEGIELITGSSSIAGQVALFEIRESSVGFSRLGAGCMDLYSATPEAHEPPPPSARGEDATGWWDRVVQFGHRVGGWFSADPPDDDETHARRSRARADRQALAAAIAAVGDEDAPTHSESEITQSIVALIQAVCSDQRECRLYIYSDLLDSRAKSALRLTPSEAAALGRERATALLTEYQPHIQNTRLTFLVWGFGRDDPHENLALDDTTRAALRLYWRTFFDTISPGAPQVIYDVSPVRVEQ